ncbi:PadR family transcriptional regulator [Cellulomonas humilata]|uniref:DNA-binding PadR family transcriptional regulator n=1 Tax=Cellulomonas humilata TaxID=144055 RepID=A0ABU0EJJ9_9CELL|nr:PadR family transcriptional regulator [Cellulomonas humilata]MDQ0375464.1 DNA-binding PadR family transcriptional regulator [Cellulomonas humilata]
MRHPHHPFSSTTTDPTAERGRTRRRRGDFPDAPYEEGFDPRRGGPRGAFPHEHHEHDGHRGFGPGGPRGFGGPGFGPGGRGRGPGRRAGRGDIRAAILLLLAEEPMHGYQLIQQIGERSGGTWRPSPGAIYPALNLLEDEGLIAITSESGRKMATLTEAGGTYVTQNAEQLGSPWEDAASRPTSPGRALRGALEALGAAAHQVARTGTDQQATKALEVLDRARRDLYLILAGDPQSVPDPAPEA